MIVQSLGQLQAPAAPPTGHGGGALDLYTPSLQTYAAIYRTQPNVRTCVDFLARNVAQLGVHVFRRASDTDRVRLFGHDLARWLEKPNPGTTRYRLIETLMQDLGIYFTAYWAKVRTTPLQLVALPPEQLAVEGTLIPTRFVWTGATGKRLDFEPSDLVYFSGYNPANRLHGLSPLETLRRTLAEETAAGDYRQALWRNGARFEGVIERPATAKKWNEAQATSWREQWQAAYGARGSRPGSVAVLDEGMTFRPISFNARDSEFIAARKLALEECARAYHIPLPMVGILEHATFSNIKEQHKNLYQDSLGPWLEMIQAEFERQLLPETSEPDAYVEFNIAEKLKGSFEEQAASIQALVGRPVMTANEGRARLNLPAHDDPSADDLAEQQGGPAATAPRAPDVASALEAARTLQAARLGRLPVTARAATFTAQLDRWNRELAADLAPFMGAAAATTLAASANDATRLRLEIEGLHG